MPFRKPRSGGRLRKRCAFLTGKERDPESNNDYFGARYYFAGNARWLSVDPAPGKATVPQLLNRYVYVRNDPVTYVDKGGTSDSPFWAGPYGWECWDEPCPGPIPDPGFPYMGPPIMTGDYEIQPNPDPTITGYTPPDYTRFINFANAKPGLGSAMSAGWEIARSLWSQKGSTLKGVVDEDEWNCLNNILTTGTDLHSKLLRIVYNPTVNVAKASEQGAAWLPFGTKPSLYIQIGDEWYQDATGDWYAETGLGPKTSPAEALLHEVGHLCRKKQVPFNDPGAVAENELFLKNLFDSWFP